MRKCRSRCSTGIHDPWISPGADVEGVAVSDDGELLGGPTFGEHGDEADTVAGVAPVASATASCMATRSLEALAAPGLPGADQPDRHMGGNAEHGQRPDDREHAAPDGGRCGPQPSSDVDEPDRRAEGEQRDELAGVTLSDVPEGDHARPSSPRSRAAGSAALPRRFARRRRQRPTGSGGTAAASAPARCRCATIRRGGRRRRGAGGSAGGEMNGKTDPKRTPSGRK